MSPSRALFLLISSLRYTKTDAVTHCHSYRVSLKKVIDRTDLETLLSEVRRKVEWDLGGDGIPRRHSYVIRPFPSFVKMILSILTKSPCVWLLFSRFASHVLPATPALETHLLISSTLSPPHPPSIDPSSPLRLLLSESLLAFNSPDCQLAFDGALTSAFGALEDHLAGKGLLGEVVDGSATTKGRRLAEVLVEVNSWGKVCLTADQGGLGRNDLIDVSPSPLPPPFRSPSVEQIAYSRYVLFKVADRLFFDLPLFLVPLLFFADVGRPARPGRVLSDGLLGLRRPARHLKTSTQLRTLSHSLRNSLALDAPFMCRTAFVRGDKRELSFSNTTLLLISLSLSRLLL